MRSTSRRKDRPRNSPRNSPTRTLQNYNDIKQKASPKSNDMSLRDTFLNDLTLTNANKTITDWRLDDALEEVEFHIMFLKNNEKKTKLHNFVTDIFHNYKAYLNSLNQDDNFLNKKMNYILSDLKLTLESNFNEDLNPSFPSSPSPAPSSRTPPPSPTPLLPPPLLPPPPSNVTTDEKRLIELYDKFNYVNIFPDLNQLGVFDSNTNADAAKKAVLNFLTNDTTNDYNVNWELKNCYNDWVHSARKNPNAFTKLVYNCLNKFEPINNRLLPEASSKLVPRSPPDEQNVPLPNVKIPNVKIPNVPLQHKENSPVPNRPLVNVGQMPSTKKQPQYNIFSSNVSKKNSPKPKNKSRIKQMVLNTGKLANFGKKFIKAVGKGFSNISKKANQHEDLLKYEERPYFRGGRRNTQKMRKNK